VSADETTVRGAATGPGGNGTADGTADGTAGDDAAGDATLAAAQRGERRAGLLHGTAAYTIWGVLPLYWQLLKPAGALEILAHRMVWSLVVVLVVLLVTRRWAWVSVLLRSPRRLGLVVAAAVLVTVNWGCYIWAVNSGHVVEASLGYFVNPLVTIALGVLVLRERLRPAQWVAVGTGAAAVVVLTAGYGRLPWIALTLAVTFALYGLIKKRVGIGPLESVAAETAVQFLPALGYLLVLGGRGDATLTTHGPGHAALLAGAGLVTAVPLLLFGAAAIRLPLSTVGLLQYLAPLFQFLLGLFWFHEPMPPARWAGFALVWVALALLTADALRTAHRARAARGALARGGLVRGGAADQVVTSRVVNRAQAAEVKTSE
jgi:chloramphenicol-sensitive protein RarD